MKKSIFTRLLAILLVLGVTISSVPAAAVYALGEELQKDTLEATAESVQTKKAETKALSGFTVYYTAPTGHIFPVQYRDGLEVESCSRFNAADLNDEKLRVEVTEGPASVMNDGVTLDVYGASGTIKVKVTRKNVTVANYTFKIADYTGGGSFAAGYGTAERPYLIQEVAHFANITKHPSAHYMLTKDIEMGGMAPLEIEFNGTLDGLGHSLTGWNYQYSGSGDKGLFKTIGTGGTIKNLKLINCQFKPVDGANGEAHVGLLCGDNNGVIENVHVSGCYVGGDTGASDLDVGNCLTYVGGICGSNYGIIRRSGVMYSTIHAYSGTESDNRKAESRAGGVAGQANNALFENVYSYENSVTTIAKGNNWWAWFATHGSDTWSRAGGVVGYCGFERVQLNSVLGYNNAISAEHGGGVDGQATGGSIMGFAEANTRIQNCYSENEDGPHCGGGPFDATAAKKVRYLCAEDVIKQLSGFSDSIWVQKNRTCNHTTHPGYRIHPEIVQMELLSVSNDHGDYEKGKPLNLNQLTIYTDLGEKVQRGYKVEGYDPSVEGEQTIDVTYGPVSGKETIRNKPHEHTVSKAESCVTQVCLTCDGPVGPNIDHTYRDTLVAATCTEGGYTIHTCVDCGHTYSDTGVPPLGHDLDINYQCTRCGERFPAPPREFTIYLYDTESEKPVPNASVTLGKTKVLTDANGAAKFQLEEEGAQKLVIEADGYDYEPNEAFVPGDMPSVYIPLNANASGIYEAWCNSDNVLVIDSQINCKAPGMRAKIVLKGRANADIIRYELVQDDQVIATSADGKFELNNMYFKQGVPVMARMHTNANTRNVFERELNISVIGPSFDISLADIFPFSVGASFDFGEGPPLLSGMELEIPGLVDGESFTITAGNDKVVVTYGIDHDFCGQDLEDQSLGGIMRELNDQFMKQNGLKKGKTGSKSSEVSYSAALVFEISKTGEITAVHGEVRMGYEFSKSWGKSFLVWVIPIYAGFKLNVGGEITIKDMGYDLENARILIPDMGAEIHAEIAAYGGIGCSVASAGIYGAIGGNIILGVEDVQPYFRYRFYGELGLYARLDLFFWKEMEYRLPLLYGEFSGPDGQVRAINKKMLSLDAYETSTRSYLEDRSEWMSTSLYAEGGDSYGLLQTSSYNAIEPRIAVSGDTIMMVFMDDDGSEGFNYQHLYYSLFDKGTSSWGKPQLVKASAYADLEYDIFADDSGIYLVYTKPGTITAANKENYEAIMAGVEVYVAQYDPATKKFTGHTNVSNNNCLDSQPQITDGAVLWVSNSTNDGFGQNSSNALMLAEKTDGVWQPATAMGEKGATVTSIDLGVLAGKTCIALIRDSDCDLTTETDRYLELRDTKGNVTTVKPAVETGEKQELLDENGEAIGYLTSGQQGVEGVRFDCVDGVHVLQWCGANNIWQLSTFGGTPISLLERDEPGLTDEFKFVKLDEEKSMILYTKNSLEDNIAGSAIYAVYYADGHWGKPVAMTETLPETYVDAFDGCAYNGKLLTAYVVTEATVTEENITRVSHFATSCVEIKDDLAVGEAEFLESQLVQGGNIDIHVPVTNQSWQKLSGVTVQIKNGGTVVYEQAAKFPTTLHSGQTGTASISLPKEKLTAGTTYSIYVDTAEWADMNTSNNKTPLILWYTDFAVTAEQMRYAGKQQIHYAATNNGNTSGSATLWIYKKNGEKKIELYKEDIALDVGKTYSGMKEITDNFYTAGGSSVVYVEVLPKGKDLYAFNDTQSVSLKEVQKTATQEVTGTVQTVTPPTIKQPAVSYDRYAGGTVAVTVTENSWKFTGVEGLTSTDYSYSSGRLVLKASFLKSLSVGYHYYTLNYSLNGKTSSLNLILEVTNKVPVTLSQISVNTKPAKASYWVGENLNTAGLTLTASYSDGSTETITTGFTVSGFSSAAAGTKTVTVTYKGKTAIFQVAVMTPPVVSVEIRTLPNRTFYGINEELDLTGLTLKGTCSDGSTRIISSGFTASGFSSSTIGTNTVTVNYDGMTTSYAVTVLHKTPMAIQTQPKSMVAKPGETVNITVEARGTNLTYQWKYKNAGEDKFIKSTLASSQSPTLVVSNLDGINHNGRQYKCVITDVDGETIETEVVTLGIAYMMSNAWSQTAEIDEYATFSVKYSIQEGVTYQWQFMRPGENSWANTGNPGNKTDTLSVAAKKSIDGYKYRCIITDPNNVDEQGNVVPIISREVTLTVIEKVFAIKSHPQSIVKKPGETATFTVSAKGYGLTYQWKYRNANATNFVNTSLPGNQTPILTVSNLDGVNHNGRQYMCVVKDVEGNVLESEIATLRVAYVASDAKNQSVLAGNDAVFAVKYSIQEDVTYQWEFRRGEEDEHWKNTGNPGNKTATLTVPSKESINGYKYRCQIMDPNNVDAKGNVLPIYSKEVTLTVKSVITSHPKSVVAKPGSTVTFSVTAQGQGLTYQWKYKNPNSDTFANTSLTGYNTPKLTVSKLVGATHNGRQYICVVKDAKGNVYTSEPATLTVAYLINDAKSQSVQIGENAVFKVNYAVKEGVTYQWQYKGNTAASTWSNTSAAGNKTDTLTVAGKATNNRYMYRCIITDTNFSTKLYSKEVYLNIVEDAAKITKHPTNNSGVSGSYVDFSVSATGDGLSYQWQWSSDGGKTWANTKGKGYSTPTLSVKTNNFNSGYMYRCVVKSMNGNAWTNVYSNAATLTVKPAATITLQPKNVTVADGKTATFRVTASGTGLTYQWQWAKFLGNWKNTTMTGATTNTLKVPATDDKNGRYYRCVITNSYGGTVTTQYVQLTVE